MVQRILVIGTGSIGRRHAENFRALGAEVTAIGWRATSVEGVETALAGSRFDGMVIATETQIRLPLIVAAAKADVPIYVEKPLAFCSNDLNACLAAAAPIAARSMLGLMMRYHPAFRDLAQADLSDSYHFSFAIGHDVTQWRENWRFSDSYAAKPQGGGVLLDLCHELDMAACLFPGLRVESVHSHGHTAYPGVDMASRIALASGQVTGCVAMDYLAPRLIRQAQINGTKASRSYDFAAQTYRIAQGQAVETPHLPLERNEMFMAAASDFLALIAGKPLRGIEHFPRLDRVGESCRLTAQAWEQRRFIGTITKDIP
ncbi:gfo/Idh/MocA family oxidoreductase [Pseudorhodobacter sp. E13]|nr:gfo/Idh/MocA family oxidoreductase [Pseudorhodobacter sp. E13]